jgi:DNA-binding response OmpR family regulator
LEKIIDVYVCKIRKKVKAIGVEIVTHWGAGYSLALKDVQVVRETSDA